MKAIWKGFVKSSLVTIPVKMYRAIAPKAVPQPHSPGENLPGLPENPWGLRMSSGPCQYGKDRYIPVTKDRQCENPL